MVRRSLARYHAMYGRVGRTTVLSELDGDGVALISQRIRPCLAPESPRSDGVSS
jgi:hypothetical protein